MAYKNLGKADAGHDKPLKNKTIGDKNTRNMIEYSLFLNNRDVASPRKITENKYGITSIITANKLPFEGKPNQW